MFSRIQSLVLALCLLLAACAPTGRERSGGASSSSEARRVFRLSSPAFVDGGMIPPKYTCDGENISPPLQIDGQPPRTKSFALIVDDPDALGDVVVHWVLWNIDPYGKGTIEEGKAPPLSQRGVNSTGRGGYSGPCPPEGLHHYRFKVYAVTKYLEFVKAPTREELEEAMRGITADRAMLTGTYVRAE